MAVVSGPGSDILEGSGERPPEEMNLRGWQLGNHGPEVVLRKPTEIHATVVLPSGSSKEECSSDEVDQFRAEKVDPGRRLENLASQSREVPVEKRDYMCHFVVQRFVPRELLIRRPDQEVTKALFAVVSSPGITQLHVGAGHAGQSPVRHWLRPVLASISYGFPGNHRNDPRIQAQGRRAPVSIYQPPLRFGGRDLRKDG